MKKRSERTLKMMENYKILHDKGLSAIEIARQYGLDCSYVYGLLGEIAEREGVTRESLLIQPHPTYSRETQTARPVKSLDFEQFQKHFDALMEKFDDLKTDVNQVLAAQTEFSKIMEESATC